MTDEVIVQVVASGTFHRAYLDGEVLLTAEGCNLDDAGALERVDALPPDVAHDALCQRCLAVTPTEEN